MKRLLLLLPLAFVLLWSQSAFADTFGNSAGANDGAGGASNPTCSIFSPASSGTITKITTRFNWNSDDNFRVAIYNASAGTPTTFIAQSSSDVLVTATGDYDATISASVTGGASYALCAFTSANGAIAMTYTNGASGDGHQEVGTYPTFPSPYGTDFPNSFLYRIWATYTPSGGGGGSVVNRRTLGPRVGTRSTR